MNTLSREQFRSLSPGIGLGTVSPVKRPNSDSFANRALTERQPPVFFEAPRQQLESMLSGKLPPLAPGQPQIDVLKIRARRPKLPAFNLTWLRWLVVGALDLALVSMAMAGSLAAVGFVLLRGSDTLAHGSFADYLAGIASALIGAWTWYEAAAAGLFAFIIYLSLFRLFLGGTAGQWVISGFRQAPQLQSSRNSNTFKPVTRHFAAKKK